MPANPWEAQSIHNAFKIREAVPTPVKATTIADSISVDLPRDGVKALRALRESNGDAVVISDQEILQAQKRIANQKGVFCEPSAATAFAGFLKFCETNLIKNDSHALVLLTGSGMKDLNAAEKIAKSNTVIRFDPNQDDIERKLGNI